MSRPARSLLALVTGAAVALSPLVPAPPAAAAPASSETLWFGSFDPAADVDADLWSVSPGGTHLRRVTSGPGTDICPDVSPDGRTVAFCSDRSGTFEIWTTNPSGSQVRRLTRLGDFSIFPDWSPDGREIAFCSGADDLSPTSLRLVDPVSGRVVALPPAPAGSADCYPSFSPDGRSLAFVRQDVTVHPEDGHVATNGRLMVLDLAHGTSRALTSGTPHADQVPDWSPDGRSIAFHAGDDVWIARADGSGTRNLTRTPDAAEFGPAFSPDGGRIAFTGTGGLVPEGSRWVQTMRLDGTSRRVVAAQPGLRQAVPAWGR